MSRKSWKSGYYGSDGNDDESGMAWGPSSTPGAARSHPAPADDIDEERLDLFVFHIDWSEADGPNTLPPGAKWSEENRGFHQVEWMDGRRRCLAWVESGEIHSEEDNIDIRIPVGCPVAIVQAILRAHAASLPGVVPGRGPDPQGTKEPGETGDGSATRNDG